MVLFCLMSSLACGMRIAQMIHPDPAWALWFGCAFGSAASIASLQWVQVVRLLGDRPVFTPGFYGLALLQVAQAIAIWIPGLVFDRIPLRRVDAAGFPFWGSTPAPYAALLVIGSILMAVALIAAAWDHPRDRPAERRILVVSAVCGGVMMQTSYLSAGIAPWIPPLGVLALPLLILPTGAVLAEQVDALARSLEARVRKRTVALNERNADLEAALERAEAARESQARFLANVSHELRTPLTGVLGMLDVVRRDPEAPDAIKLLGVARRSGAELLNLINELLDAARIEAEMVVIEPQNIVLARMLRDLSRTHDPAANAKGILLEHRLGPKLPRAIVADPTRLGQILHNLLGNAVKFTNEGSVSLTVQADASTLYFIVEDTGPGIGDLDAESLFSRFTQADDSTTRLHGGTGLGLSIARDLARLMGGDLTAANGLDVGARFTLSLPRVDSDDTSDAPTPVSNTERPSFQGLVMVADDDPTNLLVVSRMLRAYGIDVVVKANGAEVIAALAGEVPEHPDLVLMDCYMPVLDGFDATRQLRQRGITLPIVALTASAGAADRAASLKAGMDDHLAKPIVLPALELVLERYLGSKATKPVTEV